MRYYAVATNLRASPFRTPPTTRFLAARNPTRSMSSASAPSQPPEGQQPQTTSSSTSTPDAAAPPTAQTDAKGAPLPLPAPPADGADVTRTLDVNGGGVRLDHLGPLVVNQDGTMSRIANWAEMSQIERDNTLRVLGKRNQLRLKTLRGEDGQAEEKK
jgi:hypothetical protein